jgi:hypothetical protein
MGRFNDEWLIDRALFDYVQGGSCACCSFALFMPDGTAGLIQSMSELETDAANAEVAALDQLPWPPEMRDQVWMERVRLRLKLKTAMKDYKEFYEQHGDSYEHWFQQQAPSRLQKLFQLPRTEVTERLKQEYSIHAAFGKLLRSLVVLVRPRCFFLVLLILVLLLLFSYDSGTVLCAVVEQVAHFEMTGYPTDGRGEAETNFEAHLSFGRRGGFGLDFGLTQLKTTTNTSPGQQEQELDPEMVQMWFRRHQSLGGPKLLDRNPKISEEGGADDVNADETTAAPSSGAGGPSFRADRRVIRVLIARHWADVLQRTYLSDTNHTTSTTTTKESKE